MNTDLERLCCLASNPSPSLETVALLRSLSGTVQDWEPLLDLVKHHRIGALLYWHHQQGNVVLPKANELQLASWFIRNKKVATLRDEWLTKLTNAFDDEGIKHAYLKGSTLCHTAYPSSFIRSMDDVDILIDQTRNDDAFEILTSLGVAAHKPVTPKEIACHQWPVAPVWYEGIKIDLEIHTRVLSRRIGGYGVLSQFLDTLVPFKVGDQTRYCLSHEDFLITQLYRFRHLTEIFRLIDVADIVGYLDRYAHEMDWHYIYSSHPWIRNSLAALHAVTPFSDDVIQSAGIPVTSVKPFDLSKAPYAGLPVNRYLLAKGMAPDIPFLTRLKNTASPSEWWMRLAYGMGYSSADKTRVYLGIHPNNVVSQVYNFFRYK